MPSRNTVVAVGVALGAVTMTACGGTSSETPWPVEPYSRPAGPRAESAQPAAVVEPVEATDAGAAKPAKKASPTPDAEP